MSKRVSFTAKTGAADGEIAEPSGGGKSGGLVVIQEWHGINAEMKQKVDRFAAEGFVAIAPDLYHGKVAADDDEAAKMMGQLDWGKAITEIAGAVQLLKEHPRCNGKVGVLGFCMGGALSFASAASIPGLAAVAPFYGVPDTSKFDWSKATAPVQAHFAGKDEWATPAKGRALAKEIEAKGGRCELIVHEGAGHAFMRATDPAKYHEAAAKEAWGQVLAFLHRHLD